MAADPLTPGELLAEAIWPELEKLSAEERSKFLSGLTGQWCERCGNVHPGYPCQCDG